MTQRETLKILAMGVREWNEWRVRNRMKPVSLRGEDLRGEDLRRINLTRADLQETNFSGALLAELISQLLSAWGALRRHGPVQSTAHGC